MKMKNKNGFTMVELMVILVISAIIIAIATMSLIAYNDMAINRRQNEYAQSLFVAAQNALTHYYDNGELENIETVATKNATLLKQNMLAGQAYDNFDTEYEGRLYSITVNKNGVINGLSGDDSKAIQLKSIFNKIFDPYVYDKGILENASITIEFDPQSGIVYSVLYSDVQDGFVYGTAANGYVSISGREADVRKKIKLGYYGIVDLSGVTSRVKEKPVIEYVRLINDTALRLEFTLTERFKAKATGELTYNIELYSDSNKELLVSFDIEKLFSLTSETKYEDLRVKTTATIYNINTNTQTKKELEFLAFIDSDYKVTLILDAIDFAATGAADAAQLNNSYSFRRFGIDEILGEELSTNVYANVRGEGGRYKTTAWKRSNTENPYFASQTLTTGVGGKSEYGISNARHLYNIRFVETRTLTKIKNIIYKQTASFSWSGENGIFSGPLGYSDVFMSKKLVEEYIGGIKTDFPAIPELKANHTITAASTKFTINNLELYAAGTALGIVGTNRGTIEKLTLVNVNANGTESVGAFCGVNYGTLSSLTTVGGTIAGKECVGGIFGRNANTSSGLAYSGLHNGANVYGSKYVGGIVGQLKTSTTQGDISIENCTNTGFVMGVPGRDTDLTGRSLEQGVNALLKLDPASITVDANNNNISSNMYNVFKSINGGSYPYLNEYDKNMLLEFNKGNKLDGILGYTGTLEQQIEKFCQDYYWVPCALQDPNGNVVDNKGRTYTIVYVAKNDTTNVESQNNVAMIYHDGNYYFQYHRWQFTNNGTRKIDKSSMYSINYSGTLEKLIAPKELPWISIRPSFGSGTIEVVEGADTFKNEPCYIGGILGSAEGANGATVNIDSCTSSPQVESGYIEGLLKADLEFNKDINSGYRPLLGVYTGGIVGYSNYAKIAHNVVNGGTVVGGTYVGGIVGFARNTDIVAGQSNNSDIVGRYYVGGIIGVLADAGINDPNGYILVKEGLSNNQIVDCSNSGIVIATKKYAGGITGYNSGNISSCTSSIGATESSRNLAKTYSGDYVGGIIGHNIGILTATDRVNVSSYVAGKNYVGGIIGYNENFEVNGKTTYVSGYAMSGGYVYGKDFVGGFVGVNTSPWLFMNSSGETYQINSNPNEVEGRYYIGGVVGANVLYSNRVINASFNTNNFLGNINAKAFAGGFIGLNVLTNNNNSADVVDMLDVEIATEIAGNITNITDKNNIGEVAAYIESYTTRLGESTNSFDIYGTEIGSASKFGEIKAEDYVGGVLGINGSLTKMAVNSVQNRSLITATSHLNTNEIGDDDTNVYSYAGGIIGKCTNKMAIYYASADDAGTVVSNGTYTGGLVEVNEGLIMGSTAGNIGSSQMSYVGGVVGLNKENGKVIGCYLNGKTVTGNNVVGGIVAENYGQIDGKLDGNIAINSGNVVGYGQNIGGVAGINHGTITNYTLDTKVTGTGENVGGGAGTNSGSFSNISYNETGSSVVQGNENVGGFIGLQATGAEGGTAENLSNYSDVTAQLGYAGGVIGRVSSNGNFVINNCKNFGKVWTVGGTSETSSAGGILGASGALTLITNSHNYNDIEATRGYAGGIAGRAENLITNCTNGDINGKEVSVIGSEYSGGIVGKTTSQIDNSAVNNSQISNGSTSNGGFLGGITGYTDGNLVNNQVQKTTIISNSNAVKMGGIVGAMGAQNSVEVTGSVVTDSTIKFTSYSNTNYGFIGGISGINNGSISGCKFVNSNILGGANNPENPPQYNPNYDYETNGSVVYGYGGIAGINGTVEKDKTDTGTITNCIIDGSSIRAIGDANNIANIGGIAGVNGKGSAIGDINFTANQTTILSTTSEKGVPSSKQTSFAHIGGIVGYNYGTVTNIGKQRAEGFGNGSTDSSEAARKASADSETMVAIYASMGHNGGIAGYNKSTGIVSYSNTGSLWTVTSLSHSQDNGTAGIIGYNSAATEISYCDNWATVSKNVGGSNVVGGIIGRNEVTSSSSWSVNNCVNFGNLNGNVAAGIIARVKYRGGTISGCANYGQIGYAARSGDYSAGIVASLYGMSSGDNMYITDTNNYGYVNSSATAAGILSHIGNSSDGVNITIANCVNTGVVVGSNKAGIVNNNSISRGSMTIQGCRNYYAAGGNEDFYGIIRTSSMSGVILSNNFGIAEAKYPITALTNLSSLSENNYLFTGDHIEGDPTIVSAINLVKPSSNPGGNWQTAKNNIVNGLLKESGSNAWVSQQNEFSFEIVFSDVKELSEVNLFPYYASDATRAYKITVEYSVDNAADYLLFSDRLTDKFYSASDADATQSEGGETFYRYNIQYESTSGVKSVNAKRVRVTLTPRVKGNIAISEIGFNGVIRDWSKPYIVDDIKNYGYGTTLSLKNTSTTVYDAYKVGALSPYMVGLDFKTAFSSFTADKSATLGVLGTNNNARQTTYLSIDTNLFGDGAKPNTPIMSDPAYNDLGGSVEFNWEKADHAYSYQVEVNISDGTSYTATVYDTRIEIPTINRENLVISVEVKAKGLTGIFSDGSASASYTVNKDVLPAPQVKFVLTDINDTSCYRVIIENADSYITFGGTKIVVSFADVTKTITVDANGNYGLTTFNGKSGSSNYLVSAYAEPVIVGYGRSVLSRRESHIPSNSNWKNNAVGTVSNGSGMGFDYGFLNITPETLSYSLGVKHNNYTMFYRSELLATDISTTGLGIPMVYSSAVIRASTTISGFSQTIVSNLPLNITDSSVFSNVFVRSYPIAASNEIILTGITLAENISIDELLALKVTDTGELSDSGNPLITGEGNARTLKGGYVVFYNGENSYTVMYNALVKASQDGTGTVQVYEYSNVTDGIETEAKPVISGEYDQANNTYKARFDSDASGEPSYLGGEYSYTLTGVTKDGAVVIIESKDSVIAAKGTNLIELDTNSWNYTSVTLTVNRKGTYHSGSKRTKTFGNSNSLETKTKIKLSQIAGPSVRIQGKDNLVYLVSWNGLTNEEELLALDYYKIKLATTIKDSISGAEVEVTANYNTSVLDSLNQNNSSSTDWYVDLGNITGVDSQGVSHTGEVVGGTSAKFSVNAVAKADTEYADGPDGVVFNLSVPTRLVTPSLSNIDVKINSTELQPYSINEFETAGFNIQYKGEGSIDSDYDGHYQLAIKLVKGDLSYEVSTKDAPINMLGQKLGDLAKSNINATNGVIADFAGGEMIISLRAVADSNVSSLWSSEFKYTIPDIKLDEVDLMEAHSLDSISAKIIQGGEDTGISVFINQNAFKWIQGRFAGSYEFELTRYDTPPLGSEIAEYVDGLKISFTGSEYTAEPIINFKDSTAENPEEVTLAYKELIETDYAKAYTYEIYKWLYTLQDASGPLVGDYQIEMVGTLTVTMTKDSSGDLSAVSYSLILPDSKLPAIADIGSIVQNAMTIKAVNITAKPQWGLENIYNSNTFAVIRNENYDFIKKED